MNTVSSFTGCNQGFEYAWLKKTRSIIIMSGCKTWHTYLLSVLLLSFFLITGCRGCREDSGTFPADAPLPSSPTVTYTDPAIDETNVPVNKKIAVAFSEAMDPASLNATTFSVTTLDGTPVLGSMTYTGLTVVLEPAGVLAANATYTATVTTGARGMAGNALAADFTWNFTTGAALDLIAPTVLSTDPADHAVDVPINQKISVPFSKGMDPRTINSTTFTLTKPDGSLVLGTVTYIGLVAVFTPSAPLQFSTLYKAKLSKGIKDLEGNALAADYNWSFTGVAEDVLPPTVLSTDPADGATGVAINQRIAVFFSEKMDPLTITTANFTVAGLSGTVAYDAITKIATFKPTAKLAANTTFNAAITIGAKDLAGNALATKYTWSFTSGAAPDTTAPIVASTDPANGATGIATNTKITVLFSKGMDPLTISSSTFTLAGASGLVIYDAKTKTATFDPATKLAYHATYTATIDSGAKDLAGNALAANYTWSFMTGDAPDTTAPTVTSTDPANRDSGVFVNKKIASVFSKGMDPSTINTTTCLMTGPSGINVSGVVTYLGLTANFAPSSNLAFNATYTFTITTGAKDLLGNALAANYTWSFTTGAASDTTAPTVTSTDPTNRETGVPTNKKIATIFSEGMELTTINTTTCSMTGPGGTLVPGTVTYIGRTANFAPTSNLAGNATYTFTITTDAKDLAGNALAANYTWTFTTGAAPDITPPTVTSTDPANRETGVPTNKKLASIFSEGMDSATINTTTCLMTGPGGAAVSGTLTFLGKTANFTPATDLAGNATYTFTITTGAKDLAGNALAA
ncbi:MAG: Ig-like domain-containing protein, partial [Candidatus Ozemobacteraceae bacterium]